MITTPTDPQQYYIDKYEEPRHHIRTLLGASVVTLDIPSRTLYPLADAGVKTVADLVRAYRAGIMRISRIGIVGAAMIGQLLRNGDLLSLDMAANDGY